MHDFVTVKKLSDSEISTLIQTIDKRMPRISNSNDYLYELMIAQKECLQNELSERREVSSKQNDFESINLTDDTLSRSENDEKSRNDKL